MTPGNYGGDFNHLTKKPKKEKQPTAQELIDEA